MNTPFDKPILNNRNTSKLNSYVVSSFILGLLSILFLCSFQYAIILGGFSIAFAILSRKEGKLHGLSIAGIVLAGVGVTISIVLTILVYNFYTSPEFPEFFEAYQQYFNQIYGN